MSLALPGSEFHRAAITAGFTVSCKRLPSAEDSPARAPEGAAAAGCRGGSVLGRGYPQAPGRAGCFPASHRYRLFRSFCINLITEDLENSKNVKNKAAKIVQD